MRAENAVKRPILVSLPAFGITAFSSRHAVRFRMAAARHPYHKIAMVVSGNGSLQFASAAATIDVSLVEGCIVRVPAGTVHRFIDGAGTPMTLAVLCISDVAARQLPARVWADVERLIPSGRASRPNPTAVAGARQLVRRIAVESASGPFAAASVSALATLLLVRLLRAPSKAAVNAGPAAFAASLEWLDQHFAEPTRVDDLASRAGLSYRGYTAAFRRHTGTSVVQYVTRKRLSLAARLIRQTDDIATSAFEAGFGDLSHFYRAFGRQFGHSPGRLTG